MVIGLTDHALDRYRRRMRRAQASRGEVEALLNRARVQSQKPAALQVPPKPGCDRSEICGYAVAGDAVFVLAASKVVAGELVAVTCLRRRGPSKADRRERRANALEGSWAA